MDRFGKGISPKEAADCHKAAEQGDTEAQVKLGQMYHLGQGVAQDDKEAVRWYRKAAEQGLAEAKVNLGYMYYTGEGVVQHYKEAARWFRQAAEQGEADAQVMLGGMYESGRGVPQDPVLAHMWFNIAAAHGDEKAQKERDRIAQNMTPKKLKRRKRGHLNTWNSTTRAPKPKSRRIDDGQGGMIKARPPRVNCRVNILSSGNEKSPPHLRIPSRLRPPIEASRIQPSHCCIAPGSAAIVQSCGKAQDRHQKIE